MQCIGEYTVCCNSKLGLSLSRVSVCEEKNTPMNNNLVCASRSPFAAGVKTYCACWQQGLNSPPSAAQPSATDITELQELATVLCEPAFEKGCIKQRLDMLELIYSWCV